MSVPGKSAVLTGSDRIGVMSTGIVLVAVLITFGFWFAEPIEDGDLYFHMAYAKQMLSRHTLVLDHTPFTFTPADGNPVYCAWLGELALWLAFRLGGTTLLFVLRYLVMGLLVLVPILSARHVGQLRNPLVPLGILLAVLMSSTGGYLKPELFSCGLMALASGLWFWMKVRPADRRLPWGFPILILLWVNTHGAFVFGLAFLFLVAIGELFEYFLGRPAPLPVATLRHLLLAPLASCFVIAATPYGLAYPRQLLSVFVHPDAELGNVAAYATIFENPGPNLSFVTFLWVAAALLGYLLWRAGPLSPSILIPNLGMALLYTRFLRTTYLWAPLLAVTVVLLASRSRTGPARGARTVNVAAVVVAGYLSGRVVWESLYSMPPELWLGFGVGPANPVVEAEFVKRFVPGERVGCTYDAGSYLLFTLWPERKVLVDNRYFPFKSWLSEYWDFERGLSFDSFLQKYPCDLFVVNLTKGELVTGFLGSPSWRLAFFGPSAAVFVPRDRTLPAESDAFAPDRFDGIHSVAAGAPIFQLALQAERPDLARLILARLQAVARGTGDRHAVGGLTDDLERFSVVKREK